MTNFYHYTTKDKLEKIIQSEKILPSPGFNGWEKESVWLSSEEKWENSASSLITSKNGRSKRLNPDELKKIGYARIKIDQTKTRIFNISQYRQISRISSKNFKLLTAYAKSCNSKIMKWGVSFGTIHSSSWEYVEIFDTDKNSWVKIDFKKRNLKEKTGALEEIRRYINLLSNDQKTELSHILMGLEKDLNLN